KSWLYSAGSRTVACGTASCRRMSSASSPPIRKKPRQVTMYRMPICLWSTVVTHSSRRSPVRVGSIGSAYSRSTTAIPGAPNGTLHTCCEPAAHSRYCKTLLLQPLEIRRQRVHVGVAQVEVRHVAPRLDGLGIL